MYEPSRHLASYYIAGLQHWDGALILNELKPGEELQLAPEPDNPFDPEAIAIYYKDTKLGYIPAHENSFASLMMHYGHATSFELRVQQVNPEASPWKQVYVGLYVTDARTSGKRIQGKETA